MNFNRFKPILLINILLFGGICLPVYPQSYKNIRIAYINVQTEGNIIPDEFLQRAKRNNFTHIMPLFYPTTEMPNGFNPATARYNNGSSFNSGRLYDILFNSIHKIREYGFECIPEIEDARFGWNLFAASGIQFYNYTWGGQLSACIAPGIDPDGAELTVSDILRVLEKACDAADYSPPYVTFAGYSENFTSGFGPNVQLLYGKKAYQNAVTKTGSITSIDQQWLQNHSQDTVLMILESMKGRLDTMHTIGGKLKTTKMIVFGDMFSPEFENSMGYSHHTITGLPARVKSLGMQNDIFFMPWHYPDIYYIDYNTSTGQKRPFKTGADFRWFTDNGCKIIVGRTICDNNILWEIPSFLRGMRKTMDTMQFLSSSNIIGFTSFHWTNAYSLAEAGWNTMEYFAYWTQTASPDPSFRVLPAKKDANGNIVIPRLLFGSAEVTQGDYLAATGQLPFFSDSSSGDLTRPAEMVTYYDAILYCNARSKKEGLDTVYSYASRDIDNNLRCWQMLYPECHRERKGYFIPNGAEWQYAYMGGLSSRPYWGSNSVTNYAWCYDNTYSYDKTYPVRQKLPNAYGLYDMAGNVEEWTEEGKVWGGCYFDYGSDDKLKANSGYSPGELGKRTFKKSLGFRVARLAPPDMTPILNLLLGD